MEKMTILLISAFTFFALQLCGNVTEKEKDAVLANDTVIDTVQRPKPALESIAEIRAQMAEVERKRYESSRKATKVYAKRKPSEITVNGATVQKVANTDNFVVSRPKE